MESFFIEKDQDYPLDVSLIERILNVLLKNKPFENDATLSPAWLDIFSKGLVCMSLLVNRQDQTSISQESFSNYSAGLFAQFFPLCNEVKFINLDFGKQDMKAAVSKSASQLLANIWNAISNEMITNEDEQVKNMIQTVNNALTNVFYRDSWGYIMVVAQAQCVRLGYLNSPLMSSTLDILITFRDDKAYSQHFPFKNQL